MRIVGVEQKPEKEGGFGLNEDGTLFNISLRSETNSFWFLGYRISVNFHAARWEIAVGSLA